MVVPRSQCVGLDVQAPPTPPQRADEAVHDLARVLAQRENQRIAQEGGRPTITRANSEPRLRADDLLLFPEVGRWRDVAQPGGFRRQFAKPNARPEKLIDKIEDPEDQLVLPDTACQSRVAVGHGAFDDKSSEWSARQTWLFRYVMFVSFLNYSNKTVATSFLPIVLQNKLSFSLQEIGLLSASFPVACLLCTPASVRLTSTSKNYMIVHSVSLVLSAVFSFAFGMACTLTPDSATIPLFLARFGQGAASALYFSVTMTIMTRTFPSKDIPSVVGLVETAIAAGSMVGRVLGGLMYQAFGFLGPFFVEAVMMLLVAAVGLLFASDGNRRRVQISLDPDGDNGLDSDGEHDHEHTETVMGATERRVIILATTGPIIVWLTCGFYDTCLAIHLNDFLGPLDATAVGVLVGIPPLVYTLASAGVSVFIRETILVQMMLVGAILCAWGLFLLGPSDILYQMIPAHSQRAWSAEIWGLSFVAAGMSLVSIPSLPVMQKAVAHAGEAAMEGVAKYCILGMSVGEALGPVLGGVCMDWFAFSGTATLAALIYVVWACAAVAGFPADSYMASALPLRTPLLMTPLEVPPTTMPVIGTVPLAFEPTLAGHFVHAVAKAQKRCELVRFNSI